MQNGPDRSVLLLHKLAQRLAPETLAKLAAENLTTEDIVELQKAANVPAETMNALIEAAKAHKGGLASGAPGAASSGAASLTAPTTTVAGKKAITGLAPAAGAAASGSPGVWAALGEGNLGAAGRAVSSQADKVWGALKKAPGQAFGEKGPGMWEALKRLGGAAHANPAGAAAIGLPTAALAYLAYKALSDRSQKQPGSMGDEGSYGEETEMKLSSMGLTPDLRAGLDKLAEDPGVQAACFILEQYGLLPH